MTANQACHGDVVNLALSSRFLLAMSDNALQRHNRNRDACFPSRFGDVQQSPYPLLHPLCVIRDIIRDAEVAWYPIKIIIGDFTALDGSLNIANNANNGGMGIDQILVNYRSKIFALVNSNRYISAERSGPQFRPKNTALPPPSFSRSCQTFDQSNSETSQ